MLLELYACGLEQQRVSVSKLCAASGVPPTTALRWLDRLVEDELVIRVDDRLDRRRVLVELSCKGMAAMDAYFASLPLEALPL